MATHTVTPKPRVLTLGHSYIRRLQKFMEHHIGYLDLSLQVTATADIMVGVQLRAYSSKNDQI